MPISDNPSVSEERRGLPGLRRRFPWAVFAAGLGAALVLGGCGEDSPSNPVAGDPVREFWQGGYSAANPVDHGAFVLDIVRTGSAVTGELVFRSQSGAGTFNRMFVKGTFASGRFQLGPNRDVVNYLYEFSVSTDAMVDSALTGTFTYAPAGLVAEISCRQVPVGSLGLEWSIETTEGVRGLAYDEVTIWVSTPSDFIRMDGDGNIVNRVSVTYRPGTLWTSDALTSDGTVLWGHLPTTVTDGSGSHNRSQIIEFTKTGTITNTFEIPHRTSGLATDGGELWSLPIESDAIHRFDETGTILESVTVSLPDLVDLDYDGTHFWAIGWFLSRLYQLDRTGQVLRVYDLPQESGVVFPAGIVFDGAFFWYAVGSFDVSSRIYKLTLEP